MPELYEVKGKKYRIPDNLKSKFLTQFPNARSLGKEQNLNFSRGGKKYNIPQSLADKFKSQFPATTQLNVSDSSEVDRLRLLYDHASKKYDLGNYDEFYAKMHDPNKRKILYQGLSKDFDLGDFQSFESKISPFLTQQSTQLIPDPMPSSTDLPLTTTGAESTQQPVHTDLMEKPGISDGSQETTPEMGVYRLTEPLIRSLEIGSSKLGAGLARLPAAIYNTAAIPQNYIVSLLGREDLAVKAPDWAVDNPYAEWYDNNVKVLRAKNKYYDKGFIELLKGGKFNDAFRMIGLQIAENIPQQIAFIVSAYSGIKPVYALAVMGGISSGEKTKELQNIDIPEFQKGISAFSEGALEALTESMGTLNIASIGKAMIQKIGIDKTTVAIKYGVSHSMRKAFEKFYPTSAPIGEGIEEFSNAVARNWIDKATGVDPDRDLFDGAADAFILGFGTSVYTTTQVQMHGERRKRRKLKKLRGE